jgi:hypothetical protein
MRVSKEIERLRGNTEKNINSPLTEGNRLGSGCPKNQPKNDKKPIAPPPKPK